MTETKLKEVINTIAALVAYHTNNCQSCAHVESKVLALLDEDLCASCGKPRSNHPYRHQFKSMNKPDTTTASKKPSMCPDLTGFLPWDARRGELVLTIHHILTEPVCPVVTLTWETSNKIIYRGCEDTVEEAIKTALEHDPEIKAAYIAANEAVKK